MAAPVKLCEVSVEYPDKIYNRFEIIEKTICGERFYGLVKIYRVLGISLKRQVKVRQPLSYPAMATICSWGFRWVNKRSCLEYAIKRDNEWQEYQFRKRMTK